MITEEDFIKKYNDVKESVVRALDLALERAIGHKAIDLENAAGNYSDVYPLIAAVLECEIQHCIAGSAYDHVKKQQRQQCDAYKRDHRIWCNYAGDYKDKRS